MQAIVALAELLNVDNTKAHLAAIAAAAADARKASATAKADTDAAMKRVAECEAEIKTAQAAHEAKIKAADEDLARRTAALNQGLEQLAGLSAEHKRTGVEIQCKLETVAEALR